LSYIDLSFEHAGVLQRCDIPYVVGADRCEPDGGSILVNAAPASPGQEARYTFQNLLLNCYAEGPDGEPGTEYLVRVSGSVSALAVTERLDTTGLHPMFGDTASLSQIPADRTVTDFVQHAGAAATELEEAACYYARAGQGAGTVFSMPGVLFGGADLPATQGDSQVLAGLALLGAAAAHLSLAHDVDMPLDDVLCDEDDPPLTGCPSDSQLVATFNGAVASAFRPEHFAIAERLTSEGLSLLDAGLSSLDANSLFVKNSVSAPGLDMLADVVRAARQSLESGDTALPHVSPAILFDLHQFFAEPRNPRSFGTGPLLHEEQCDADVCSSSIELAPAFLDQYFAGTIDAEWEGTEYTSTNEDAIEDAGREMSRSFGSRFVLGN
jgi:hypothetical protein